MPRRLCPDDDRLFGLFHCFVYATADRKIRQHLKLLDCRNYSINIFVFCMILSMFSVLVCDFRLSDNEVTQLFAL